MWKPILTMLAAVSLAAAADTLNVRDYIKADGISDDSPALNQLFASAPDYSEIVFPAGTQVTLASTVFLKAKSGLMLHGLSAIGNGSGPYTRAPQFNWKGPAGGTMLAIDKSQGLVFENLLFNARSACAPVSAQVAGVAIDVDQSSPNPGGITTDLIFRRIAITVCGPGNGSFTGIRFSWTSAQNVEHMRVEDSTFNCPSDSTAASGLLIGNSANAKNYKFLRNSFMNCQYGIRALNGSFEALGNMFTSETVDIYASSYVDTLNVQGNVTEGSQQFFVGEGIWPIELSNNKISTTATPAGKASVEVTYAHMTAKANKFDQSDIHTAFQGHGGAALASIGNEYPSDNYDSTGWSSFESGVVTMQDKLIDPATNAARPTGISMSGIKYMTPIPMAGMGILYYDAFAKKWLVSEDGKSFVKLVP